MAQLFKEMPRQYKVKDRIQELNKKWNIKPTPDSLVSYGFDHDTLVQSTKFGTLISYNILIDFRRGATLKLLCTPLFRSLKHFNREN